jgi:hypothetical protein
MVLRLHRFKCIARWLLYFQILTIIMQFGTAYDLILLLLPPVQHALPSLLVVWLSVTVALLLSALLSCRRCRCHQGQGQPACSASTIC